MRMAAWIAIGLLTIDVTINLVFSYPLDPKITSPSQLRAYFEYGRSVEAKLRRMTRQDRFQTAPITLAGWYEPLEVVEKPASSDNPIVTFYGMSHAVRLAEAVRRVSNQFNVRIVAAPGATANWAYGAYLRDRGGGKSRAAVLAFMAANLPMIGTMSPMTWNIDAPIPYTADRFYVENANLRVIHPPYTSFEEYVDTFYHPSRFAAALDFFAKNDSMYNHFIMETNALDHSSLFRLVRRAYGQRFLRNMRKHSIDQSGFQPESEQIVVSRMIVHEFTMDARRHGMIPVIFLVNNLGYSDHLFQALKPALTADKVQYVSSHSIVSPSNPRGYLPDSHFTDEVDNELARALLKLIGES